VKNVPPPALSSPDRPPALAVLLFSFPSPIVPAPPLSDVSLLENSISGLFVHRGRLLSSPIAEASRQATLPLF